MRLIDADELKGKAFADPNDGEHFVYCQDIDEAPTVDAVPVRHGRWEGHSHSSYCGIDADGEPVYRDGVVYYCSNPKCRRKTVIKENYCPNCGAKMDLEDNYDD